MLYLSLCAIASDDVFAIDKDDSNKAKIWDNLGSVLSLISELHDQEKIMQLEIAVGEKDHQLNMFRALMRES